MSTLPKIQSNIPAVRSNSVMIRDLRPSEPCANLRRDQKFEHENNHLVAGGLIKNRHQQNVTMRKNVL